ncbi:hypothetical protein LGL55_21605 [Clostridium tagluense]|uniref:hypothetical protein n=1 Tax=Clostridium tagluense TaxID=360422 RepID=UPI001CF4CF0B|nr:hypothetical protein [Clostridium tagluense]MCB2313692.1 hypothetical protein [Clostridium tagluense]MCB2318542.1 hypothetical protein [Clostridium tagluense]MCB2323354.1 hypothetical protein [Clostridium tagluense]MCB2328353.1 hypothetical protein [Clostridium tagluense]MCB2333185.1 hypothetical protein [Clostridium tagluense]
MNNSDSKPIEVDISTFDNEGEDNLFVLFPNAESQEDLEEELEHSFTRMMDN